jgi:hypothetical protein
MPFGLTMCEIICRIILGKKKKKNIFFMVIVLGINFSVFGQYFDYVSLGYNTREYIYSNGERDIYYYMINQTEYSKMAIYPFWNSDLMFEENRDFMIDGIRQNYVIVDYFEAIRSPYSFLRVNEGYYFQGQTQIWRANNGRLVYVEIDYDGDKTYASRIEYSNNELMVYLDNGTIIKYYNIPQEQLVDKYLTLFIRHINNILNGVDRYRQNRDYEEHLMKLLSILRPRELAIFRNFLYAVKGYRFATQSWTDLFNRYLTGYNGRYSNDEVMAMFTANERWLLDLIIQYERR